MTDLEPIPEGVDPIEATRLMAAMALPVAARTVISRALDPSVSTSNLLSLTDQLCKLANFRDKSEEASAQDHFVFNIHFSGEKKGITIDCQPEQDALGETPAYIKAIKGNLSDG